MPTNFTLLRLLLALSIAVSHYIQLSGNVINWAMPFGQLDSVPAFFIISGWIVSASYEKSQDTLSFQTRRVARILPGYLIVVSLQTILVFFWAVLDQGRSIDSSLLTETAKYFLLNSVFLNFLQPTFAGFVSHSPVPAINPSLWTMKVEIAFYLILPLLVVCRRKLGLTFFLVLFAFSTLYFVLMQDFSVELARQLPGQMRYFVLGMICERLTSQNLWPKLQKSQWLVLGAIGLVASQMANYYIILRAIQPITILLFIIAASLYLPSVKPNTPDISYGIYLLHAPVTQFGVQMNVLPDGGTGLFVVLFVTMGLAFALNRYIENPGIRLGQELTRIINQRRQSQGRPGLKMARSHHR